MAYLKAYPAIEDIQLGTSFVVHDSYEIGVELLLDVPRGDG